MIQTAICRERFYSEEKGNNTYSCTRRLGHLGPHAWIRDGVVRRVEEGLDLNLLMEIDRLRKYEACWNDFRSFLDSYECYDPLILTMMDEFQKLEKKHGVVG